MMAQIDSNIHYVKFMRGSISAWETLQSTPEKISNDTLYFIYQNAQTSTDGKLYLGSKLISGSGEGNIENININDIGDIYIDDETLADKQILVYNETSKKWDNTSLSTIINTAVGVMEGATASTDGASGLVPVPKAGDQNKFLKGNKTWATIDIPTFDSNVFVKNLNQEISLAGFNLAPVGAVPIKTSNGLEWSSNPGSGVSRVITTLENLEQSIEDGTANENIIYMIPNNSDPELSNQYDEYMIIQGELEHLGTFGEVNLENYVLKTTFQNTISDINNILNDSTNSETGIIQPGLISKVNTIEIAQEKVGDLSSLILSDNNTTLVEEVNSINNNVNDLSSRLRWHELNNN